ncbi:MAG: hypothetical protein JWL84_3135 [Rhodospirillales bacterium]|nr:hypothetical protein [Rhodospirillales bacterium]
MTHRIIISSVLAIGLVATISGGGEATAADTLSQQVNRGLVEIMTGSADGSSVRIAEDLPNLLDDGSTRRIVPVVGKGSIQNLLDLRAMRGIDLAIVQSDVLDYAKQEKILPDIGNAVLYVAKLYNEEFHLLVRGKIKTIDELAGKTVNFGAPGAGAAVTGPFVFNLLKIRVQATAFNQAVALEKLKSGEIQAMAFISAKPAPIVSALKASDDVHLLAVPIGPGTMKQYVPSSITAGDYPAIVQGNIDTISIGTVLAVANLTPGSGRYKNVAAFVDAFFTQFPKLAEQPYSAKWREVNLAAELPGWRRFPPAERWLKQNANTSGPQLDDKEMREIFTKFVDEHAKITTGKALTPEQKDDIFERFQRWQSSQTH